MMQQYRCTGRGLDGDAKAFTLIEMLIVIAVIGLVSSALVPVVVRPFVAERQIEAMNEMAAIQEAIAGRPEEGHFGFIGDIGALGGTHDPLGWLIDSSTTARPGLNALLEAGTMPLAVYATTDATTGAGAGVVAGWNGPYLRPRFTKPLIDPWGVDYRIERNSSDTSQWRLRCAGPDHRTGTADDIVFPSSTDGAYFESQGRLTVELMKANNFATWPMSSIEASQYTIALSPTNASPSISCTQTANTNRFTCTKTWFGQHHLMAFVGSTTNVAMQQKVVISSRESFTQLVLTKNGSTEAPLEPCEKTPSTWTSATGYSGIVSTLAAEHAFCAVKPKMTQYQHVMVDLSGTVTPSDESTECTVSVKLSTTNGAGAWTVAGPLKVKGTTGAIPFTLSGGVPAPVDSDKDGVATIYAKVDVTAGTGSCTAGPPTAPALASSGTVLVMGHP